MGFTQILFLFGGLAIAGPLLAHLLARPRFKRVPFTMLHFLRQGELESQSRRRFRDLLLLLMRCAIIVCIAVGFAGPQLRNTLYQQHAPAWFVAVDDSLSMRYENRFPELMERLKHHIATVPAQDRIHLYGLASGVAMPDLSREAAIQHLASLSPEVRPAELSTFIAAVDHHGIEHERAPHVLLASDFTPQLMRAASEQHAPVPVSSLTWIAPEDKDSATNLAVTSASIEGNHRDHLRIAATITNTGTTSATGNVSAQADDRQSAVLPVAVPPGQNTAVMLELMLPQARAVNLPVEIHLDTEDGLPDDNRYYIGVMSGQNEKRHVLIVCNDTREAFLLKTAITVLNNATPQDHFAVHIMPYAAFRGAALSGNDIVIATSAHPPLDEVGNNLAAFMQEGGRFIVFMHPDQDETVLHALFDAALLPAVPSAFNETVTQIIQGRGAHSNPVSHAADVRHALQNYRLDQYYLESSYSCNATAGATRQWMLQNDAALIYYVDVGAGSSILVNSSADSSMGPLLQSPAAVAFCSYLLDAANETLECDVEAGKRFSIPWHTQLSAAAEEVAIATPGGVMVAERTERDKLLIPPINEVGWAVVQDDPLLYAGLNVPENETNLKALPDAEIERLMRNWFIAGDTGREEQDFSQETGALHLWPWLFVAAIVLLLLENMLANRWVR